MADGTQKRWGRLLVAALLLVTPLLLTLAERGHAQFVPYPSGPAGGIGPPPVVIPAPGVPLAPSPSPSPLLPVTPPAPVSPAPPITPLPVPSPPPVAPVPAPGPARSYTLSFDLGSSALTPQARDVVSLAAALAIRLQAPVVEVNAYAGVDGDRAYVWDLGRRRAQAVALELMLDGVPAGVIRTSTNGPSGATPQGTPALDDGHVEIVVR